jgi:hypothetical protein
MKLTRNFLAVILSISLVSVSFLSLAIQSASAQDSKIALQRGYRTGYSDGYMSGYRDAIDNAVKGFETHNEYNKADRAYSKEYGALEDYRDGYQQGFEIGYGTGFEKRSYDATIPTDLKKRGIVTVTTIPTTTQTTPTETVSNSTIITTPTDNIVTQPVSENTTTNQTPITATLTENIATTTLNTPTVIIPTDTEIIVELLDNINTETSREGDKFTAKVISPYELTGSIVEGRISKIQKPGKIKRRAQVLLSFDRIVMLENKWSNFNAVLTEVLPTKGDNVKRVDNEGTAVGKGSLKDDSIKVGAATGTGLVVGALVGGPVGAAVGAGLGAAFGVGAVVVERGKHIKLNKTQQLRIKTVYETQIR